MRTEIQNGKKTEGPCRTRQGTHQRDILATRMGSFIGPECTALICIVLNQGINLICKCKCITTSIYPFMGTMQWKCYGIFKYRVTYWVNPSKRGGMNGVFRGAGLPAGLQN